MVWKPRATVATIVEQDNAFLMVEETQDGQRVLNQPAGHLDPGESLAQAAVRETLEETAYHVALTGFVGLYRWIHPPTEETYLRAVFAGQVLGQDPERPLDTGIIAAHWMDWPTLESWRDQLRTPMVRQCLVDYRQGQIVSLDCVRDVLS